LLEFDGEPAVWLDHDVHARSGERGIDSRSDSVSIADFKDRLNCRCQVPTIVIENWCASSKPRDLSWRIDIGSKRARSLSMIAINEIAPDLFRLSIFFPQIDMQFNHFLVRDEEPLLFHAGLKAMFPALREGVTKLIDPAKLRHIAWSHFESDECGALNEWLQLAPQAQPVCTLVGKLVTVDDFSIRPAFGMTSDDVLSTGKYRYRFYRSPHIPHGWDAGVLFEETRKTVLNQPPPEIEVLAGWIFF